jgi:hypothetical protein
MSLRAKSRNSKSRKASQARRRRLQRAGHFERLEDRRLLNADPIANPDPFYFTSENTALTVGSNDTKVLDNDWDPEASSLTASVVAQPDNGTVTNFSSTAGTFTYTPDNAFTGIDTFTYKVNDGTDDSNVATVSIAVGGHLGPRTNLEENSLGGGLLAGELQLATPLTPGIALVYNSNTIPEPIVVVETSLESGSSVPDELSAQLTFNASAGTDYTYSTSGLSAGDTLRFALQHDATALATGRYDYDVEITADMTGIDVEHTFAGSQNVVNRSDSTHPFGRGWQLAGLDSLDVDAGTGVLWVGSDGSALWFAEDGSGGFDPAEGDLTFSTLVKNAGND